MPTIQGDHLMLMIARQERMVDQTAWESESIWVCFQVSPKNELDPKSCHDFDYGHDFDCLQI